MIKESLDVVVQKNGTEIKLKIKPSNYKIEQELKTAYAIAYRKSIGMGVATRSSMTEILKREGIWGDKEEEGLTKSLTNVGTLEAQLLRLSSDATKDSKKQQKDIAIKLAKARSELYSLIQIKSAPLMHTAETIAEEYKIDKFITLSTVTEDGALYFKDHDEFIARRVDEDTIKIYDRVIEELSKTNVELIRNLPENKWLMSNGMMSNDGEVNEEHLIKMLIDEPEQLKEPVVEKLAAPVENKPSKKKTKKKQKENLPING